MTDTWANEDLHHIDAAPELDIMVRREDGTLRRWTPIWVVTAGDQVYVRTWHRRTTGWFGDAVRSRRARIRVPGLEIDVTVEDLGSAAPELSADIDEAYRTKYGAGSGSMVTPASVAATLRLSR